MIFERNTVDISAIDPQKVVREELPNLAHFYNSHDELHSDVHWLLGKFFNNRKNHPIIDISYERAESIARNATHHYGMMIDALQRLFDSDNDTIRRYMKCSATSLPIFNTFIDYARESFRACDRAIYGRYDIPVDAHGNMIGVYEFNGDTPVMLFESVNLQNMVADALGNSDAQYNTWYPTTYRQMRRLKGKTVAVACTLDAIEDLSTSETIMQIMYEVGAEPYLCDLKHLNHDLLHIERPFEIDGVHKCPDAIFMLLPWEEMLASGAEILANWKSWHHNVKFFEPPWRWFMSNKGFMAWVTHLTETNRGFAADHVNAIMVHTPTYLSPDRIGSNYVSKPKIGRLGQNIKIITRDSESSTSGAYGNEELVYQPIVPTHQFDDRSVIATAWISGGGASSLAFRSFGGAITSIEDEYWVPHRLVNR